MADKKVSDLDPISLLALTNLLAVGDPATGYLYKTTLTDVKTLFTSGVSSFNSRTGAVVPANGDYTTSQVTEGSNLYHTDARSRTAISLTTSGSGAASYNSSTGVFNIPVPTSYSLPTASSSVLGGVMIGSGISISSGTISVSVAWSSLTGSAPNISTFPNNSGYITSAGSISGSAGSVAWAGVTGKPTALSYFSNDLGNYGGWITGITSANVTTALGFTPYNSSNPVGYITASALSSYLPLSGGTLSGNLTAPAFYETSDIRFKNILEVNPVVDLSSIGVIKFTYKEDPYEQVRFGYSAQDVQAILPTSILGVERLLVNYSDIHTLKIAHLEAKILELENKLK